MVYFSKSVIFPVSGGLYLPFIEGDMTINRNAHDWVCFSADIDK